MSETAPVYIPCTAGNNVFSDLLVRGRCGLVVIYGHAQMDLTPADAAKLGQVLIAMAREAGWRDADD